MFLRRAAPRFGLLDISKDVLFVRYLLDIITEGFEDAVRSRLGVDEDELSNSEINQPLVAGLAEIQVKKRIKDITALVSEADKLLLQNAVLSYVCYLLCPSMARRLNAAVKTIDTEWRKDKIDWGKRAEDFFNEYEGSLLQISTIELTRDELFSIIPGSGQYIGRI